MQEKETKPKMTELEELSKEELIKIFHQQLEDKESLKEQLGKVQESSANLVINWKFHYA